MILRSPTEDENEPSPYPSPTGRGNFARTLGSPLPLGEGESEGTFHPIPTPTPIFEGVFHDLTLAHREWKYALTLALSHRASQGRGNDSVHSAYSFTLALLGREGRVRVIFKGEGEENARWVERRGAITASVSARWVSAHDASTHPTPVRARCALLPVGKVCLWKGILLIDPIFSPRDCMIFGFRLCPEAVFRAL